MRSISSVAQHVQCSPRNGGCVHTLCRYQFPSADSSRQSVSERANRASDRASDRSGYVQLTARHWRVSQTSHQYLLALHTITATSSSVPTGFTHQSINQSMNQSIIINQSRIRSNRCHWCICRTVCSITARVDSFIHSSSHSVIHSSVDHMVNEAR